jgi:phosphoglycolate phosphatase-like HAD superfamily hydrolase
MKLFVWDFHGVLEIGNDNAVLEITNLVLEEFNYEERISSRQAEIFSGLKWYEYFQLILPWETTDKHLELQKRCFEISKEKIEITKKHVKLNENAKTVLEAIKNKNHYQIIISNTDQTSLEYYIQIVDIGKFFHKGTYFGADAHKNKNQTKQDILKNFLKNNSFNSMVVIGDSPKDIELAKLLKNSISYLYSYPNRPHREAMADCKITNLLEILKEI